MTAHECLTTLRRRWYVLALVMLCMIGGLWTVNRRPITYQGCDGLYLATPQLPLGTNTYAEISPSLAMATGMVVQTMTSQPMRQKLQSQGLVTDYEVTETNTGEIRFPAYTQPTVQICSSSRDPRLVISTTEIVTVQFQAVLRQMQASQDVPPKSSITATVLSQAIPLPILGRPSQAYIGVVLLGIVGGVALTLWSDPLLVRWSHRRTGLRRTNKIADGLKRQDGPVGRVETEPYHG